MLPYAEAPQYNFSHAVQHPTVSMTRVSSGAGSLETREQEVQSGLPEMMPVVQSRINVYNKGPGGEGLDEAGPTPDDQGLHMQGRRMVL